MRFSEHFVIPYILKPADHAAGVDGDSIHMGKVRSVALIFQFGAVTGDAVLKIFSGATAGTKSTAETFNYRLADADQGNANADQYGDWTTSAALTLTAATYDNKTLIVEMKDSELTADQEWLTPELSSAASALNLACVAIGQARYVSHDPLTVIS